jgi:hypothetical protein
LIDMGGELQASGKGGASFTLGRLVPADFPTIVPAGPQPSSPQLRVEVDLDRQRIEALEALRLGGHLEFVAALRCRFQTGSDFESGREDLRQRVPQGTWVEILQQLGYRKTLLLEVPIADDDPSSKLATVRKHLAAAQDSLLRMHWRESVGSCRDALESLTTKLGDKRVADPEVKEILDGLSKLRSKDKTARLRVLRGAMLSVCHLARHADDIAGPVEWEREDAVAMLAMIAALIQQLPGTLK